ncbi:uncharacterized protein LAESUDRAFT_721651 [Laetiporus sulphureus 93-53]|uniref:Uncharacterized protein n=1 Tax=Laetiporus sulphureus 93-53 TaxID=1314785 RepID=A0A165GG86_9APHY|nr:uncharacterized protein LAESUDRAFT_721651 [Laetiporus sulphureus 93-53]KZT10304.1 hypothetical protein LAESUDRAFT_721651 [Laetiporus sulphureus 93-53]
MSAVAEDEPSDGQATSSKSSEDTTVGSSSSTPLRGRTTSRYPPSLSRGDPGRVPLHRRGTSKTYECLEDLLREAGYKETRIYTPETEREERRRGNVRGGVDTVVGYLASWMPSAGRSDRSADSSCGERTTPSSQRPDMRHWSVPSSPLAHMHDLHGTSSPYIPISPPLSASGTSTPSMRSHTSISSDGHTISCRRPPRQPHPHTPTLRPQTSGNLRTYAQVSAAQGYLRHMASVPTISRRPLSTCESSVEGRPSLPPTWRDSVAKAVASSGTPHAYVGGPQTPRILSRSTPQATRAKNLSKHALADKTNRGRPSTVRSLSGAPLGLTSYLSPTGAAPSAVSTARVLCRSAPASRSSSRSDDRASYSSSLRGQQRGRPWRNVRRASKCDGVPTLASTCIENDTWSLSTHWVDGRRVPIAAVDRTIAATTPSDEYDDEDDEDDAELDFARLLVPPKRQYSIQSLRRHLHHSRSNLREQNKPWEDGNEYGTRGLSRRTSVDEDDGEGLGWEAMGVPGFNNNMKRRDGLPRAWGGLSSRS